MGLMCFQCSFLTNHPFSSSTNDPLAVPGASDGRHTHVVCTVNDEHETTALWCEHSNFTVVPCWKKVKSIFSSQLSAKNSNAAACLVSEPCLPLIRTTDDAVAISHEVQGIAGHVGYRDAEQLFGFVYVPQPDILLRAGRKQFRCPTRIKQISTGKKTQFI